MRDGHVTIGWTLEPQGGDQAQAMEKSNELRASSSIAGAFDFYSEAAAFLRAFKRGTRSSADGLTS